MLTPPESWITHLLDEFDRLVANLIVERGTADLRNDAGQTISVDDLVRIRNDVVAIATTDRSSLAYQVLLASGRNSHITDPCPTCDAAIRLAWGASRTRRACGLPAVAHNADASVVGAPAA